MNARPQDNRVSANVLAVDDRDDNGAMLAALLEALLGAGTGARSERPR